MRSINEVVFFALLGLFFIVFFLTTNHNYVGSNTKKVAVFFTSALVFTLFFVGYSQITGVCLSKDGYEYNASTLSPDAKLCRGGEYMWRGNSPRSKYCQQLATTPEGRKEIDRYSCGAGYTGMPGKGFTFTPLSNDQWENERCDSGFSCDEKDNGIF